MAEIENLAIVIDVVNSYEEELNDLLFKLGEIKTAVETVDGSRIDFDTFQAQSELTALQSQMAALRGQMAMMDDDIRISGGMGGGGGLSPGQIGAMSQQARSVTDRLRELDLRMSDVHNALARVVPLLLVVVGALPAVIGSLVSLAAAALAATAALVGIGAVGAAGAALVRGDGDIMAGFQDIVSEIGQDLQDAFAPLARRLAPLFEDAISGLDRLFEAVAAEGDALVDFADTARDFGQWVINTLPSFMRDLAQFADAAGAALAAVGEGLGGADWFRSFAEFLADTLPAMMQFGALLFSLVEHVLSLSVGFLKVTNGIIAVANGFLEVITLGGLLDQQVGVLIASFLAMYGAMLLLNSALVTATIPALVSLGRTILQAIAWVAGYVGVSGSAIASTLGLAASMKILAGAIALTGIGALAVIFGAIAGAATSAATNIDSATKSLREFQNQQQRMTDSRNPYANPSVERGSVSGSSRFSGGGVNVTIEGDADEDTTRTQTHNGMYRMERTRRSR